MPVTQSTMTTDPPTAGGLRELHLLHQRAKALRDLMVSGPKTLAAREAVLASRRSALETSQKAIKDVKAQIKNKEVQVQGLQTKIEDLLAKRNLVRKQDEYNALSNQVANDRKAIERIELEVLEAMEKGDAQAAETAALDADVQKLAREVVALKADIEAKAESQKAQLKQLETAIVEAEELIAVDMREQYRRVVKQRGPDALAAVEENACTGCYVSITPQMLNELINGHHMVFCLTCGRVLYLAEHDRPNTKRREK